MENAQEIEDFVEFKPLVQLIKKLDVQIKHALLV